MATTAGVDEFKILRMWNSAIIDQRTSMKSRSFWWSGQHHRSPKLFRWPLGEYFGSSDVLTICVGKSTYARAGIS